MSENDLSAWVGRSETVRDTIVPTPVAALTATLDHPAASIDTGMALPPLWPRGCVAKAGTNRTAAVPTRP